MERFRQYRQTQELRDQQAQVQLHPVDLIYPYFVVDGTGIRQPIPSLTNVYHFSVDQLLLDLTRVVDANISKILLFGVIDPSLRDDAGSYSGLDNNLVARAVRAIKTRYPDLLVMTDVCLCGYTEHGHCGVLAADGLTVENNATLPLLSAMALTHAQAGADYVCPSAMMDGQVGAMRQALDQAGFFSTRIMGYSAKYASAFYGPFRDAVASSPKHGDRKTYQMDYRNLDQAVREVAADVNEGADIVMVKPAHTYLDVIVRIREQFPEVKLAAYQVSGEYMMIKSAAAAGVLDEPTAMLEALTAIKRAGADFVITYAALDASCFVSN